MLARSSPACKCHFSATFPQPLIFASLDPLPPAPLTPARVHPVMPSPSPSFRMTRHVYVGNLPLDTTPETLRTTFEQEGRTVAKVELVKSPKTGKPRGFGFVEMESEEAAEAVIRKLDGTLVDGRPIKVKEGKPRPEFRLLAEPPSARRGGNKRRR
jgi:RNA recognition motif-containing protein